MFQISLELLVILLTLKPPKYQIRITARICSISILNSLLVSVISAAMAAVPSAGLVLLIMVCDVIGVPISERLGLLMTLEWLL